MRTSRATTESSPVQNIRQAKYYFYYCPVFDFWAFGKTKEEAWKRLKEDLFLLLVKCSGYESRENVYKDYTCPSAEIRA